MHSNTKKTSVHVVPGFEKAQEAVPVTAKLGPSGCVTLYGFIGARCFVGM
jgi:hypothetical protein